jgi:hypothetical protein
VKKLKIAKIRFCKSLITKGRILLFVRKINFFTASDALQDKARGRNGGQGTARPTFQDRRIAIIRVFPSRLLGANSGLLLFSLDDE